MQKHNYSLFLLSLALILISSLSYSQSGEICNNGIDDDGDGFVDCFDNECLDAVNCSDDFVAGEPICQVEPTPDPTFDLKLQSSSDNGTASGNGMLSVGDIDGDGFPEIVTVNFYNDNIYILDGRTSAIKHQRALNVRPYLEVMIADIDGDGCAEIFMPYTGSGFGVMSFNCDLSSILWQSSTLNRPGNIGVADFDGDGLSELYARDEIFDAHTGDKLHASQFSDDPDDDNYIDKKIVAGGVAVDILDDNECANCSGQELVLGGLIYSVDINRAGSTASLNLVKSIDYRPVYYAPWRQNRTATSVADYNLDGYLDVVMPGRITSSSLTRVFFWDVKNNVVQTFADNVNNWPIGAGRPNIADIDGDGQLNITFVSGPFLYALDENMQQKWKQPIIEGTSGTTGTTVFDFNGDGEYETVYRDENFLYIVNGNNGSFYTSIPCRSLTFMEYPIVADVNNDGATEICVACITSNTGDIFNDIGSSQVRVFESKDDEWVPARKLWNQHAYFNVNINDDLTVPREPQKHHLIWSSGICGVGDTRPLNSFLNQSPFITDKGCPNYAAGDLNFAGNIVLNTPQCPDTDFTISFDLSNDGDKDIQADIPITFYDGDPEAAGATKLNTVTRTITIPQGTTITVNNLTVIGPGTSFVLYIAINHDGINGINGNPPTPIGYPSGGLLECLYDNNIGSIPVDPTPFPVSVVKVSDNEKCDNTLPDNGEARAYVLIGGAEVTAGYTFNWYNTSPPSGPADYSGTSYSNLAAGTYSVVALNDSKMCSSDTVSVTIIDAIPGNPTVVVNVLQQHSSCSAPNGQLQAVINGDADPSGFDFEWYVGNNIFDPDFIVGVSDIATNLTNQLYSVVVTDNTTGCQHIANGTVTTTTVPFLVTAITDSDHTDCGTPNGSASANVDGQTAGYTFNWYIGPTTKAIPDHTGITYTNLAAGMYAVTATDNNTGCISTNIAIVTIGGGGTTPVIAVNVDIHETSCTTPNGMASASVGGQTAGYTFNWFSGQNTNPANEVTGSPNATISGLSAGIYTVLVTQDGTGCNATEEVIINNNLPVINITPNITNSSTCTPPNGVLSATATGGTAPYTYLWYADNTGSPNPNTPDFTGQTITGQPPGNYTILVIDASSCTSTALPVEILDSSISFNLSTTTQDQTSCDVNTPNGSATATYTGAATDFNFEWRSGSNNTTGTVLTTDETITGQPSGTYTVLARNITTGCEEIATATIGNDVRIPNLTATPQPMDVCVVANGSITISVDVGVPADYTFSWYDGPQVKATPDYPETGNTLSGIPAGFYSVSAVNNVRSCDAIAVTNIEVLDNAPAIQITQDAIVSFIPNDCDDTGTIKVDVSAPGNTSGFDIEWYNGVSPFADPAFQTDNTTTTSTANNLVTGLYTVVVTNLDNGCQASDVYNLPFSNTQVLTGNKSDAQSCPANDGSIEVNLDISDPQTVDPTLTLADFNLRFYEGTFPNGVENVAKRVDAPTAVTTFSNLMPGDYYIIAFSDAGLSIAECPSIPVIASISESANTPQVTLTRVDNNTECEAPFNGILEIDINNGANAADYNITWHRGASTSDPVVTTTANNNTQANQLQGGVYTVDVVHVASTCSTSATYNLIDVLPSIGLNLNVTNKINCNTDGSVAITNITENGMNAGTAGYTFAWLENDGVTTVAGASGTSPAGALFSTDTDYIVSAERGVCSTTQQFNIMDVTEKPKITSVVLTNNTECTDAPNGSIALQIDGIVPASGVYDIDWTGLPAGAVLSLANTTVANLRGGTYDVSIERLNAPNGGCTITARYTLIDVPPIVSIEVDTISNTNCAPNYNGAVNSVTVNVNGVAQPLTDYNIEYFTNNTPPLNPVVNTNALAPGIYYARATHNTSTCRVTPLVAFEISDDTVNPSIGLSSFEIPVECASHVDDLGKLQIALSNTSGSSYTVQWSVDGTPLPDIVNYPTVDLSDPLNIIGLPEGTYSVTVTNTSDPNNACTSTEVYALTPAEELNLIADASPVTTCMTVKDGSVFANILNADNSTYDIYWFAGAQTPPYNLSNALSGSPAYQLMNLTAGQYTVIAVSTSDITCISDPVVVEVQEDLKSPNVVINEDATLTNCDPARPNGQLSATANGQTSGYTFEWYNGTDTSGTPDYIGNTYSQLTSNIDYTVVVTDLISECVVIASRQITEDFQVVSVPEITVISQMTSCISPNGSLSATVDGSTDRHTFEWFIGTNTSSTPIGNNALIEDLDVGEYTVRATNPETGCSATNTGQIIDERTFPEFEVEVIHSSCMQSNGGITITAQQGSLIDSIQWTTPDGQILTSPSLAGYSQGVYQFTVYGPGGCGVDGQATIIDDIIIYNGVSSNNDGMNDIFLIECIQNFENNSVKIYTRAGQIVYEASFYDNDKTSFTGIGNKGIYLSGKEVPDGTYFYIVDKGDGSEAQTGYLELTR